MIYLYICKKISNKNSSWKDHTKRGKVSDSFVNEEPTGGVEWGGVVVMWLI